MPTPESHELVALADGGSVSGLLQVPPGARACYVLAHGAGAGMTHPFMAAVAAGLAERGIATLALPVPLHGARRQAARSAEARACRGPRRSRRGGAAVAGAAADRRRQIVRRPHDIAGAGARAAARRSRARVPRLSAAPGRSSRRATARKHLFDIAVPMLFLQGTRDTLAALDLIEPLCQALGARATLQSVRGRRPLVPRAGAQRPHRCAR